MQIISQRLKKKKRTEFLYSQLSEELISILLIQRWCASLTEKELE